MSRLWRVSAQRDGFPQGIVREGKSRKFVEAVEQITFSGAYQPVDEVGAV